MPSRKYEVAPRFLKLKEQKELKSEPLSSPELISPPTPTSSSTSLSSISLNSTEIIPPPRASFPVIPAPTENRQRLYDALESASEKLSLNLVHNLS